MHIIHLDHLVLTVSDIGRTCQFYSNVLGMEVIDFDGRTALKFGNQKINLHQHGNEIDPKAINPTPGSADICLICEESIREIIAELSAKQAVIEKGPVERTGATGKILSVYLRDPDKNLIEISNYLPV